MFKQCVRMSAIFILFWVSMLAFAQTPLRVDEAFKVDVKLSPNQSQAKIIFDIAPGYHLYADRTQLRFVPKINYHAQFPKPDDHGYYNNTTIIPLILHADQDGSYALSVDYQGCANQGFCYPPMSKTFMLSLVTNKVEANFENLLNNQYTVESVLSQQSFLSLLVIFFVLGVLLAFTPCVLPMLPILTGIIVGQANRGTKHAFVLSLVYVLGMSLAYSFAGLLAALAGSSLQVMVQKPLFISLGSLLFLLLALSLFEFYELPISRRWQNSIQRWSMRHEGGTYVGVFCMGLLATLMVSPCVTAPLVGVLLYIGQTGDIVLGVTTLFILGLGMGLPLILVGISAGKYLPKQGPWMSVITKLFGLLMLAMSIWLIARILPDYTVYVLWLMYAVIVLLFFTLYLPKRSHTKPKLIRQMLIIILALSIALVFGVLQGTSQFLERMLGIKHISSQAVNPLDFTFINNVSELKAALMKAQAEQKPVILDFYADWCDSCHEMDKDVFGSSTVQKLLSNFIRLRVDLTDNSEADHALMEKYQVIAPPTVLFFNRQGEELPSRRIVGGVSEAAFLTRLQSLITASCGVNALC